MRLTNRLRHRLVRAVKNQGWDAATVAQTIACIERVRTDGGDLTLAIPEYNGDAPFFRPNDVVVQFMDYLGILDSMEETQ